MHHQRARQFFKLKEKEIDDEEPPPETMLLRDETDPEQELEDCKSLKDLAEKIIKEDRAELPQKEQANKENDAVRE